MSGDAVIDVSRQAMIVALQVSLPLLIMGLITGVLVSIFQAVTSIQEITLTFVPKILAVLLALVIFGPWMLRVLIEFTTGVFVSIPQWVR